MHFICPFCMVAEDMKTPNDLSGRFFVSYRAISMNLALDLEAYDCVHFNHFASSS